MTFQNADVVEVCVCLYSALRFDFPIYSVCVYFPKRSNNLAPLPHMHSENETKDPAPQAKSMSSVGESSPHKKLQNVASNEKLIKSKSRVKYK